MKSRIATYGQLLLIRKYSVAEALTKLERSVRIEWNKLLRASELGATKLTDLEIGVMIENGGEEKTQPQTSNKYWAMPSRPELKTGTGSIKKNAELVKQWNQEKQIINEKIHALKDKPSGVKVVPFLSVKDFEKILSSVGVEFDELFDLLTIPENE